MAAEVEKHFQTPTGETFDEMIDRACRNAERGARLSRLVREVIFEEDGSHTHSQVVYYQVQCGTCFQVIGESQSPQQVGRCEDCT